MCSSVRCVLGPLLFSLYSNDLQHILKIEEDNYRKDQSHRLQHFFYADDLHIYLRLNINQLESRVAALTRVANRIYQWAGAAALKLNALKFKVLSPLNNIRIAQKACFRPCPL